MSNLKQSYFLFKGFECDLSIQLSISSTYSSGSAPIRPIHVFSFIWPRKSDRFSFVKSREHRHTSYSTSYAHWRFKFGSTYTYLTQFWIDGSFLCELWGREWSSVEILFDIHKWLFENSPNICNKSVRLEKKQT